MKQVILTNIQKIAQELRPFFTIGTVILLNGPMGIGKTTLLKEILSEYPVHSPSFLHSLEYGDFLHIDAYTLSKERFIELDLVEALSHQCVIVEWGELVIDIINNLECPKITLTISYKDNDRFLSIIK